MNDHTRAQLKARLQASNDFADGGSLGPTGARPASAWAKWYWDQVDVIKNYPGDYRAQVNFARVLADTYKKELATQT